MSDRRIKADIAGGVFCDKTSGVTNYGAYASMLVLIDARDPLRARVTGQENQASLVRHIFSDGGRIQL